VGQRDSWPAPRSWWKRAHKLMIGSGIRIIRFGRKQAESWWVFLGLGFGFSVPRHGWGFFSGGRIDRRRRSTITIERGPQPPIYFGNDFKGGLTLGECPKLPTSRTGRSWTVMSWPMTNLIWIAPRDGQRHPAQPPSGTRAG